jgi:hypothetical protein
MQLAGEREASKPDKQFSAQIEEERRRIWNTDPSTSWREITLADLYTFKEEARETVKNAGSSKVSGTASGTTILLDGGSTKNRSNLSRNRRRIRKQDPTPSFFLFPKTAAETEAAKER